jgi:hypothetical protein
MNIEIVSNNDENFKIQVKQFGEQFLASDGERVAIALTEELAIEGVEEMQKISTPPVNTNATLLENSRSGHPFNPFGGTSWEGRPNGFN